jgi:hypothetical protein
MSAMKTPVGIVVGLMALIVTLIGAPAAQASTFTWTNRVGPAPGEWYDVTYGNGRYVAVGPTGVVTSSDGISWNAGVAAVGEGWGSVTFGNGLFVAVSYDNSWDQVMTSPDGLTWTARSTPDAFWNNVTYGAGKFVAVAYQGNVMSSVDGITWTQTAVIEGRFGSVTFGEGLFVAVGANGKAFYSNDAVTWSGGTGVPAERWWPVAYGGGKFVAGSWDGKLMTSDDGMAWTVTATTTDAVTTVMYGDGEFLAVSGNGSTPSTAWTSADGATWSNSALPTQAWWNGNYGNGMYILVNAGGDILTSGTFTPLTVPGAPTGVTATPGDAEVTVSWTAPADDGGSPISGYTVTGTPEGSCTTTGATECVVTGLSNGTEYTFTVVATNGVGDGAPSDGAVATPAGTEPPGPTPEPPGPTPEPPGPTPEAPAPTPDPQGVEPAADSDGESSDRVLPSTGFGSGRAVAFALVMLATGMSLLVIRRGYATA